MTFGTHYSPNILTKVRIEEWLHVQLTKHDMHRQTCLFTSYFFTSYILSTSISIPQRNQLLSQTVHLLFDSLSPLRQATYNFPWRQQVHNSPLDGTAGHKDSNDAGNRAMTDFDSVYSKGTGLYYPSTKLLVKQCQAYKAPPPATESEKSRGV